MKKKFTKEDLKKAYLACEATSEGCNGRMTKEIYDALVLASFEEWYKEFKNK